MRIYISGRISGIYYGTALAKFANAEEALRLIPGVEPVNPMKGDVPDPDGPSWQDYMLKDIALLWDCDGIYMLPDWKESKGARIEHGIAQELGLFVKYAEQ